MIHSGLQFTLFIALCCVLHRNESQGIHCKNFIFTWNTPKNAYNQGTTATRTCLHGASHYNMPATYQAPTGATPGQRLTPNLTPNLTHRHPRAMDGGSSTRHEHPTRQQDTHTLCPLGHYCCGEQRANSLYTSCAHWATAVCTENTSRRGFRQRAPNTPDHAR
jgi:hypothetical protein